MKKLYTILFLLFFFSKVIAQKDSMYISGRFLYNRANEKIILRGINYPVLDDWDFPANMNNGNERLNEIVKTGANCVRIMWYNDYGNAARPAFSLANLDSLLTRCARMRIIPIVALGDLTCSNDWASFPTRITNWWTQPSVVALFNKHKRYTIINFGNEIGHYVWTGNTATAIVTFKNNYKTAITALRNAGIKTPLMVDAPDCGANADALISCGTELVNHDPLKNIMLSPHAYWVSFAGSSDAAYEAKITAMQTSGLPFVFGEIANFQTDMTPCQYSLRYQYLLQSAKTKEIGWLAWAWYKDHCTDRQMSPNGLFTGLGTYGLDIVNNATYGLLATATRNVNTFLPQVLSYNPYLAITCNTNNIASLQILANDLVEITWQRNNNIGWENLVNYKVVGNESNFQQNFANKEGANLYRAMLVKSNGNVSYTNEVMCHSSVKQPTIYPTIAKDYIALNVDDNYNSLYIVNSVGVLQMHQKIIANNQKIAIENFGKGNYFLVLINDKTRAKKVLSFIKN